MKKTRNRIKSAQTNILFTTTSKAHQRKKLKQFGWWVSVYLFSLLAVGGITHFVVKGALQKLLFDNPRYAVKDISVEVKGNISRRQVINASHVMIGQNIMRLDLKQIQRDVEHLPYVGEAQVIRQLPDKLILKVTERMPVARITALRTDLNMRELLYIDRDGVIIKPQLNEPLRAVPDIVGGKFTDMEPGQHVEQPAVLAALSLLKQFDLSPVKAVMDIHHFDVSHPMTLIMVAQDGTNVSFRLDHLDIQLDRLHEILDFAASRERQLATVDLTPELNVPATFRN